MQGFIHRGGGGGVASFPGPVRTGPGNEATGGRGEAFPPKRFYIIIAYLISRLSAWGENAKSSTKCYTIMVREFTNENCAEGHTPKISCRALLE